MRTIHQMRMSQCMLILLVKGYTVDNVYTASVILEGESCLQQKGKFPLVLRFAFNNFQNNFQNNFLQRRKTLLSEFQDAFVVCFDMLRNNFECLNDYQLFSAAISALNVNKSKIVVTFLLRGFDSFVSNYSKFCFKYQILYQKNLKKIHRFLKSIERIESKTKYKERETNCFD